jgi:hypothetical protein
LTVPLHLRVFLASPRDVSHERDVARRVLEEMPRKPWLRGRLTLAVVAWDDPLAATPLAATEDPQRSVERYNTPASECDLTVAIFWGRLGTPVAAGLAEDGESRLSGTQWEIDRAMRAGKPVWLYRRTTTPHVELDDPDYELKRLQYRELKAFFALLESDRSVRRAGINDYDTVTSFEQRFEQHLEAEIRQRLDAAGMAAPSSAFCVYLAAAADDMRTARLRLEAQLRELPTIEVLRELPPPLERQAHGAAVCEAVAHADLCVHLVGMQPGFPVEWSASEPDLTYPMEQLRLGLTHARAQLILQAPELDAAALPDSPYRTLVDDLSRRPDEQLRLEIVKVTRPQMLSAVLDKRRALEEERARRLERALASQRQNTSLASRAFVDVHATDRALAAPLLAHLRERRVALLMLDSPGELDTPAQRTCAFEEHVRCSDRFIIVFGSVSRYWVDERLHAASKLILSEGLPTRIGVYVAPPGKSEPLVRFPGLYTVINNTAGFDPQPLASFLTQEAAL